MSCTHGSEGAGGAAMRLPLPDWLARTGQFRAYKRLPGARRDTSLTAGTADALATRITAAEQAAARPARRAQETR